MSRESPIHCVIASRCRPICGLINADGLLWCLDLQSRTTAGSFSVVFDIGGHRAAFNDKGTMCVSAAYRRRGVEAYSVPEGRSLWRRSDLAKVQHIAWDDFLSSFVLIRDRACAEVLDPASGVTTEKLPRVRQRYASPFEFIALRVHRKLELVEGPSWAPRFRWPLESFASLDGCFSRDTVFVSEAGGPLRAFHIADGVQQWRVASRAEHYLSLAHCEETGQLHAVRWNYQTGEDAALDCVVANTGEVARSFPLTRISATGAFAAQGRYYVGADWSVIDMVAGERFSLGLGGLG